MRGLTRISLKSLGLVAPVDLGIHVTIPILNGDGGKPVSSHSDIWTAKSMFLIPSMWCFFSLSCPGTVSRSPRMAKSTSSQVIGNSKSYRVSLLCDTGFLSSTEFFEKICPNIRPSLRLELSLILPCNPHSTLNEPLLMDFFWTNFEQHFASFVFQSFSALFYLVWFWFSRKYDVFKLKFAVFLSVDLLSSNDSSSAGS